MMLVERVGDARLPTVHGEFRVVSYRAHDGHEHLAIVEGDPTGTSVLARVHSECMTGDALGSLKCDCGDQLAHALRAIAVEGRGVVVYMRGHEGRGIGLANKIKAYELQDGGLDTVDANTVQGLPVDARQYDVAAAILGDLGVESVRLMSNNPVKATGLVEHGIVVDALVPLVVPSRPESEHYLRTKIDRLGHVAAT
ncbi:GTP cyclohydrolase II [Ilumatobacter nonamiensis]|uniref:GTP cyclohydrolase II n=1 Tax=Ilumatobacter nonamiensis TaxID=467093 RepID=UPI00068898DE|nr:GTP cyclohydrolase II [Ilumatobacter nonamiensis]